MALLAKFSFPGNGPVLKNIFENMILGDADQNLELIPMAKNRSKSSIILNISEHYIKTNGLVISLENRAVVQARGRPSGLTMSG